MSFGIVAIEPGHAIADAEGAVPVIDFGLGADGCPACMIGQEDVPYSSGWWKTAWAIASVLSIGASAYHGYRRNDSLGWGIWWGLMGGLFPILAPAIGLAQGFGQPKRG